MTSRLDLRNLCRRRLGDLTAPTHWSDLQINQWINDAVADYSIYFPRKRAVSLEMEAGLHVYLLPEDFRAVLSAAYPGSQDAPQYLQRLSYQETDFWELPARYDILRWDDGSKSSELWLSESPADGETLELEILADHASLDDDGDLCTVPDRHLEILVLFVRWASLQELASTEARNPDPTTLSMSVLDSNATRAERAYRKQVELTLRHESLSASIAWNNVRIY